MKILNPVHRLCATIFAVVFLCSTSGFVVVGFIVAYFNHNLPDYMSLKNYQLPTVTRVYSGTGSLLAEYSTVPRVFIPISEIPQRVVNGFIAVEDKHFYSHHGIDPLALSRAFLTDIVLALQHRRLIGASTITQQVARNFFLNDHLSMIRKIKEALLAVRIEQVLSKERIMELYLNDIYFGHHAYGIAQAALVYFNKSLDALTIPEIAFLASLPKGPNNYDPIKHYRSAINRRNWALDRMVECGFITKQDAMLGKHDPILIAKERHGQSLVQADYFLDTVYRKLVDRLGNIEHVEQGGYYVLTSLDPRLQKMADRALMDGIISYDHRHGYHGLLERVNDIKDFYSLNIPPGALKDWKLAYIWQVNTGSAQFILQSGEQGSLLLRDMLWARKILPNQRIGPPIHSVSSVLHVHDVVLVQPNTHNTYVLAQVPSINGGIVAMDPHTGRILALRGGWDFDQSQFNRVTQAYRQPGSAIKPFVYMAALDNGYTPASMLVDAPFVLNQGVNRKIWKPKNFEKKFHGMITLRRSLEFSLNLSAIRLAQTLGMDKVGSYIQRFGILDYAPKELSYVLGSGDTTLLRLVTAYAMIDNGGYKVIPSFIDLIADRTGKIIYRHDLKICTSCQVTSSQLIKSDIKIPVLIDTRTSVISEQTAYQLVNIMEGVMIHGTGQNMQIPGYPLAGKTGTTTENKDAFFIGFSPDLVVGVYMGFDQPRNLGRSPSGAQEVGATVAGPIWKEFMRLYLKGRTPRPFPTPPGIRMLEIDDDTGLPKTKNSKHIVWDAFKPGTEPLLALPNITSDHHESNATTNDSTNDFITNNSILHGGIY